MAPRQGSPCLDVKNSDIFIVKTYKSFTLMRVDPNIHLEAIPLRQYLRQFRYQSEEKYINLGSAHLSSEQALYHEAEKIRNFDTA